MFYALVLIYSFALANPLTQSYVCQDQFISPSGGILCCDTLPHKNCEQTQKALLTDQQINSLTELTLSILNRPPSNNLIVQNCFRTALDIISKTPSDAPASVQPGDFYQAFANDYTQVGEYTIDTVALADLQPMDLLVFEERGEYLYFEEHANTSGKKFTWGPGSATNHAFIYLGNNLIIQKENTFSAVVSLTDLNRTYEVYKKDAEITIERALYSQKKINLYLKVFRKNKLPKG